MIPNEMEARRVQNRVRNDLEELSFRGVMLRTIYGWQPGSDGVRDQWTRRAGYDGMASPKGHQSTAKKKMADTTHQKSVGHPDK